MRRWIGVVEREAWDRRCGTGIVGQELWDRRRRNEHETGDRRLEMGDRRREIYIFPCMLCEIYMFPCMLCETYVFPCMLYKIHSWAQLT